MSGVSSENEKLPLGALLALAMSAFVTVLTEALPAGLLSQMGQGLDVSEALVGQLVTIYAIGCAVAAIPLAVATQRWRRRPVLLCTIAGFVVANTVTAVSPSYALTMAARFLAGISAGLLWALLAAYAARMVSPRRKGQAIAIAMVGTPLALSLGVPAGTFLGFLFGWRLSFVIMTGLALVLILWILLKVPDYPGQAGSERPSLARVFVIPGVRPILLAVLAFALAHNLFYTYIVPFLANAGLAAQTDVVLLTFGLSALVGIFMTGLLIERHLRRLTLASATVFGLVALVFCTGTHDPIVIYVAVCAWGIAFGGAPTLFQTALTHAAVDAVDIAQSMLATAWNGAIAGGGLIGGLLLSQVGVVGFAPTLVLLLLITLLIVWSCRKDGFPSASAKITS